MNQLPQRKNIRLPHYDYASRGCYFITICCHEQKNLFGKIQSEKMILNNYGKIAHNEWVETHKKHPQLTLDKFIIMPNHMHGIINTCYATGEINLAPTINLGNIVGLYKAGVTRTINQMIASTDKITIWQRSYYEHIIRNDVELHEIRTYIQNNPLSWELDRYYM